MVRNQTTEFNCCKKRERERERRSRRNDEEMKCKISHRLQRLQKMQIKNIPITKIAPRLNFFIKTRMARATMLGAWQSSTPLVAFDLILTFLCFSSLSNGCFSAFLFAKSSKDTYSIPVRSSLELSSAVFSLASERTW
jgi:hypothetical protein